MGWFVYIVLCADGTFYTGATNNLDARVKKHNSGSGAKYTRSRLPVRLVYSEPAADKSSAMKRECAIKRMTRAQKAALISE
jgi:putative endonuclease